MQLYDDDDNGCLRVEAMRAFLKHLLTPAEDMEFASHLSNCAYCRLELEVEQVDDRRMFGFIHEEDLN